jgi:putative pyruvate formate lyase activating enzyme
MSGAIRVFHSGLHFGEEPFVVGNERSGMVNLAGCHLACGHCYTPEAASGRLGDVDAPEGFLRRLEGLVQSGARNVNLVSPTPQWLALEPTLVAFRTRHPSVPLVLKTSGYEGESFARRMAEIADVLVPDVKVSSPEAARAVGLPEAYGAIARRAIAAWLETHGEARFVARGQLARGLVARYLFMPGFETDGFAVVDGLAEVGYRGPLNLMTRFVRPTGGGLVRAPAAFVAGFVAHGRDRGIAVAVDGRVPATAVGTEAGEAAHARVG